MPENTLNANLVENKGLNSQIPAVTTSFKEAPRPLAAELRQAQVIKITENNFIEALREINLYPEDYLGKEISLTGFIYKGNVTENNQIALARYMIVCCASDAMPFGILCETDDAAKYPEGTWLSVRGVVQMGRYKNKDAPVVAIKSMEQIEKPKNPYIY